MTPTQFAKAKRGHKIKPVCNHIEDEHGLCFECNLDMVAARGGKREGAGRPYTLNPATRLINIRVTDEQHAQYMALGGSKWLKDTLAKHHAALVRSNATKTD